MLRSYLTIALRHLFKYQAYAIINVLGLMVGMVCCLLILLDVQYELSYESFHQNADRIHRLDWGGLSDQAAPLARQLADEIPEIEAVVRFRGFRPVFTYGDNQFYQSITFAGPDVFEVFDFPLLRGDPSTALLEPYAMILSEDLARKLFGDDDPLGRTLMWDNTYAYKITGIMANVPRNTHYWTETLGSLTTLETRPEFATNRSYNTYVMLRDGITVDGEVFAGQIRDFYRRHVGELPHDVGVPRLFPIRDIHLDEAMRTYIYSLAAVGLFILAVACVNFTNLATARAATRAREVGVRKAAGARQWQLASQFIGESTLMAAVAFLLALPITWLMLFPYRAFAEKPLYLDLVGNPWVPIGGLAMTLIVGVLAGAYPAIVLAGVRPVKALKGDRSSSGGSAVLRRSLVTFQFLVAAVLITATLVVYQQLEYVRTKELGLNRDQVLTVHRHNREVAEKQPIIRDAFLADPRVTGFTVTSSAPAEWLAGGYYKTPGQIEEREVDLLGIDSHFADFFDIELLAGRSFDDDLESGAFLINEMQAREMGFSDPVHAIGAPLQVRTAGWSFLHWDSQEAYHVKNGVVVGVLRDVHYQSLHTPIRPLIMLAEINWKRMMTIRVAGDDVPGAMAHMEQAWDRIVPTLPYNPEFLDERFAMVYRAEDRLGTAVGVFAVLAVLVTCLGVFGLGSFMIARRTKEIGVRKCLGASTTSIVVLLSSEPVRLASIACVVAAPITWSVMSQWLQAFAYRIDFGVLVFLMGTCAVLLVAWLAVLPLARRAARTPPVRALRYE